MGRGGGRQLVGVDSVGKMGLFHREEEKELGIRSVVGRERLALTQRNSQIMKLQAAHPILVGQRSQPA